MNIKMLLYFGEFNGVVVFILREITLFKYNYYEADNFRCINFFNAVLH